MTPRYTFHRIERGLRRLARGEEMSLVCTGTSDTSPGQMDYHPECSCCWLNIAHTEDYHALKMENRNGNSI